MSMQNIIEKLLKHHVLLEAFKTTQEFHLKIENPPYMPLVIERQGDEISVAHYSELNGDTIRDPEITYDFSDWVPTSITQDPVGRYAAVFQAVDDKPRALYRPTLLKELKHFSNLWARNLKAQGFVERGKVTSLTHQALLTGPAAPAPDAHLEAAHEDRVSGGLDLD